MSGILKHLITEAKISDKITSRTAITYDALLGAILNSEDEKITDSNLKDIASELEIKPELLKTYIETAKKNGFLNADGSVVEKYTKEVTGKVAVQGKVSASLDSKIKKFKAPVVTNNNLFNEQTFKMLSLMKGQAAKSGIKNSLLLTGDPGVGKTSFIRNYAKLLGIPLITVEAPHITEEHIINIPFMILKGDQVQKDSAVIETNGKSSLKNDGQAFEIVQAESNLVTKIKTMKNLKLKDQQHLAAIAKDKNLRGVYANNRRLINSVRDQYHCILFLDEYYRNDNIKIRNILRNILNGRIGNDKIPKGTFIVYASNLNDEGVEDIPMNNDFAEMEFKAPDKEQWFDYVLKKYEENDNKEFPNIKLDPTVYNKFYDTLNQEDLSFDDENAEVRTSPRRWEQFLLYVNANLPVSNVKDAQILMSNVEINFRNYIAGEVSSLYPKVKKMVVELIKETSGIEFDGSTYPQTEWKDVLQQQLETKIKMDSEERFDSNGKLIEKEARTYVPIVSGEPGIGKTSHMSTVANNLGLHFIHVDVSSLNRESTTGIPTATQARDEDGTPLVDNDGLPVMTTSFSEPELLKLIKKLMEEAVKEDEIFPENEKLKGSGKYKFLLLFDELTRADAQVFNSIRKLLLEKSFNEQYDLPAEIMVVGALNPEDDGVAELTKHTRDVVDIIPARSSWAKTESYLLREERPSGLQEHLGFDCNASTVGAIKALLSHFQSKNLDWRGNPLMPDERLFNLLDNGNVIYISPREITDIVATANSKILDRLTQVGIKSTLNIARDNSVFDASDDDFMAMMMAQDEAEAKNKEAEDAKLGIFNLNTRYSEEDYDLFIKAMLNELRDAWAEKLSFTTKKQDSDPANFLSVTTGFIMKNNLVIDQYEAIKTMKVTGTKSIGELFEAYFEDPLELYDSPHFDNYLAANFASPQKFTQEMTDFIADKTSQFIRESNTSSKTLKNREGQEFTMPILDYKNMDLYYKYLQYVKVILGVLTKKSEYAGKVKEAERTGQYLSNLYTSLRGIGSEFMNKQNLLQYFSDNNRMNPETIDRLQSLALEIKTILSDFGFKR